MGRFFTSRVRLPFVVAGAVCLVGVVYVLRDRLRRTATSSRPAPSLAKLADGGAPTGCGGSGERDDGVLYATPSGRHYQVFGPAAYEAARPWPLVLVFHGWGSDAVSFARWFKFHDNVEGAAIVVYPEAKRGRWDTTTETDVAFVEEVVASVKASHCVDPARVFAFGFSYGGGFVHHLACKRGHAFRAVAVGDSTRPWAMEHCSPMDVLVTHRTKDEDERIESGKAGVKAWVEVDRCGSPPRPSDPAHRCERWSDCAAGGSVTFCEDTFFDERWDKDWNHTVTNEYQALTWRFFRDQGSR